MSYDLLINTRFENKWYVYKGLDNLSLAFSISEKEVKDNSSFVFIREVKSSGADVWKHFYYRARKYSTLESVHSSTNTYLSSKFLLCEGK